jgi:rhodanese-related sulfurtransferase
VPVRRRPDGTPEVVFDPAVEVAPFVLFRRLQRGQAPLLVDVRDTPSPLRLRGALAWSGEDWRPPEGADVVLVDEDGTRAVDLAHRYQEQGYASVKALFGGLELWQFALDPEVVGAETFLERS